MLPSICAALVTPLTGGSNIDRRKLVAHAKWVLANGCDGIVLFGTTGEAVSFGITQRQDALEALIDGGVNPSNVIVGVGCCSIEDTASLSTHALGLDCAALLVHPPFFFRPVEDDGVHRFFEGLVASLGDKARDILFYHFPEMTGTPISPPVIERLLLALPNAFVGIKDSTGSLENTISLVRRFPGLNVYSGDDDLLWPVLDAGGFGSITATANVAPNLLATVKSGWKANTQAAQDAQTALTGLWKDTLLTFPISEAVKEIIATASKDDSWRELCPPLSRLSKAQSRQLAEKVAPYVQLFPANLGADLKK